MKFALEWIVDTSLQINHFNFVNYCECNFAHNNKTQNKKQDLGYYYYFFFFTSLSLLQVRTIIVKINICLH